MKKNLLFTFLLIFSIHLSAQELSYYLPTNVAYNPAIPKPKDIIYHEVGEYHITHDRLVNYMKTIANAAPNRVKLETMGLTVENRPQVLLIISAQKNLEKLEQIREQHLQLSNPQKSAALNINDMPIVVYIGHSIHGNEPSGSNAALLSAYYLAAAQGKEIGSSLVERDLVDTVKGLIKQAEDSGVKLILPTDIVVAPTFSADATPTLVSADAIPADQMGLDIGPESAAAFAAEIKKCKTVFWNGPMGVFEFPNFAHGTKVVAQALTEVKGISVVGGGDSAAAVRALGFADSAFGYISTGGGASLEYLEGKELPGLTALDL